MPQHYICPTCEGAKKVEAHSITECAKDITCPTCFGDGYISEKRFINFANTLRLHECND